MDYGSENGRKTVAGDFLRSHLGWSLIYMWSKIFFWLNVSISCFLMVAAIMEVPLQKDSQKNTSSQRRVTVTKKLTPHLKVAAPEELTHSLPEGSKQPSDIFGQIKRGPNSLVISSKFYLDTAFALNSWGQLSHYLIQDLDAPDRNAVLVGLSNMKEVLYAFESQNCRIINKKDGQALQINGDTNLLELLDQAFLSQTEKVLGHQRAKEWAQMLVRDHYFYSALGTKELSIVDKDDEPWLELDYQLPGGLAGGKKSKIPPGSEENHNLFLRYKHLLSNTNK